MANLFEEIRWMRENPAFGERPVPVREFVYSDKYMNIGQKVRPGVMKLLVDIFGDEVNSRRLSKYERVMFTGAIGVGKTTFASIALPYMAHWVLCLNDPQDFYNLLPGSRIAFMQMSTSRQQARQVVFGDIFARIEHCRWFLDNYPYDPKFTTSIRFEQKDVWILPGDSKETTFEGYNILGGILDEMDSHTITKDKDYADVGYETIEGRIKSRYVDIEAGVGRHRGLIIAVGQMKKQNGFAHRKYLEFLDDPYAHVERMTLWDSFGWEKFLKPDGTRDSFYFDVRRKNILEDWIGRELVGNGDVIEIPNAFKYDFKTKPEKSLKDLAGVPPVSADPFISLTYKIDIAQEKYNDRFTGLVPVNENCTQPAMAEWVGTASYTDSRKRVAHIDIAYSEHGDSAGVAFGYVDSLVETPDGEYLPYIVIEAAWRFRAPPGGEVMISDLRRVIYELKARGVRLVRVTLDGFQSTDTIQQMRKKRISVDYQSMDKTKLGYEDLREALYDERIEFPKYMTKLYPGSDQLVNIIYQELAGLTDTGLKIDHEKDGSKDVADCIASVVMTLMGDKTLRRGVASPRSGKVPQQRSAEEALNDLMKDFDRNLSTSIGVASPSGAPSISDMKGLIRPGSLEVPDRLRPKG